MTRITEIIAIITGLGILTAAVQAEGNPLSPPPPNKLTVVEASSSPPKVIAVKPTIVKGKPKKPSRLVQALDSNQDGKLSIEEIEAAVVILKGLDQDGDGELTSDEFGPLAVVEKSTSRSILRPTSPSKPSSIRPSRPDCRPTVKPTKLGTRPSRLA